MASEGNSPPETNHPIDQAKTREMGSAVAGHLKGSTVLVESGHGQRFKGTLVCIDLDNEQSILRDVREEPSGITHDVVFVTDVDFIVGLSEASESG